MFRQFCNTEDLSNDERVDVTLYDALVNNDVNEVKHLIHQTKRDLNETFLIVRHKNHEFTNPIQLVARYGTATMLKFLIEAGCNVNRKSDRLKRSPVHMAVLNNNIGCLQLLITAQAKLDPQDIFGNSPCHYAAELGHHDALDVMIRIGTQINSQDIVAKTPLMKAVRNNKAESAIRLIRANADVNITDINNELALHFAVRNGNTELVDILLVSGSRTDVQNIWGRSPLMEAVYYNYTAVVHRLLEAGCNVNMRVSETGETALHIATRKRYVQVVKKLLEHILSSQSHTITMLETYDMDIDKFTCLLETESRSRVTLFSIAAERHFFQTCDLLASLGYADYSLRATFQASLGDVHLSVANQKSLLTVLDLMNSVTPLKQSCRRVLRRSIDHDMANKISTLPIPNALRKYLLFQDIQAAYMSCI